MKELQDGKATNKFFELKHNAPGTKARAGLLHTGHGTIATPVFMPVGTQGAVKAISPRELVSMKTPIILGNTYHLYLRPGKEVITEFGGLHKFIGWDKAILTDSGGYQIFSLHELRKIKEEGAYFRSHIDGSKHFFSPENVVEYQRILGSDIVMVLDECTPYPCTFEQAKKSMDLSARWAKRCKDAFAASEPLWGHPQFLFGIAQGSMFPELRLDYLERLKEIGFDGYAIGGLSVGEPAEMMYGIVDISTNQLPEDKPRYLMGVGTPENILECIDRGIDMFDCVLPTRNARNGQLFTSRGKINIRNNKYKLSHEVIDEEIDSFASRNYSLGYLRHLFIAGEILALEIATEHNIAFYHWLVRTAREKIASGDFKEWKKEILTKINGFIE